jgi:probable rRNA maturation factor
MSASVILMPRKQMAIRAIDLSGSKLPASRQALTRAARIFLKNSGTIGGSLSIVLLDGRSMRRLNKRSLGHDFTTDVITFDLREKGTGVMDAEIFLCPAEARRNARIYNEPCGRELLRYLAHGILHLSGYDDTTLRQRSVMRRKEDEMLLWLSLRPKR